MSSIEHDIMYYTATYNGRDDDYEQNDDIGAILASMIIVGAVIAAIVGG